MIKKGLLALAFGGLAIGMAEFTMMGILEDIARDLNISITEASNFISLYALGVVVGAPTLVILTRRYAPKNVLLFLMLLFFIFHGFFALLPGLHTLLVARFFAGLPHGAFFGVGSVVAARMAEKGKEAQAIALMFLGMTIANLAGVPIGTYIGHHHSWRITYGIVAFLGLITFLAIYYWMPKVEAEKSGSVLTQLKFFTTQKAWLMIAIIAIGTGGLFSWISYISPMSTQVAKVPEDNMPYIMVLVGLGMCFGNLLGGKLADSVIPTKAAIICFSAMAICLGITYFVIHIEFMAYVTAFLTGLISFTIGSPLQLMLINNAKGAETIAASAGQASFNIGNALGASLGGVPIALGYTANNPLLVGVLLAFIGTLLALLFLKKYVLKPAMLS